MPNMSKEFLCTVSSASFTKGNIYPQSECILIKDDIGREHHVPANFLKSNFEEQIPAVTYSPAVQEEAIRLYHKHMQLDPTEHAYMWGQCSDEYREAWRIIAKENTDECTNSIITK